MCTTQVNIIPISLQTVEENQLGLFDFFDITEGKFVP